MTRDEMIERAGVNDEESFVEVVYSDKVSTAYTCSIEGQFLKCPIVISSKFSPEIQKTLLAHECGHIIKGHTKANGDMLLRGLMSKVDPNGKLGDKTNVLSHYFENLFQDYEINSEIFTPEMKIEMAEAGVAGVHPSDVGFPEGKKWFEYAVLALNNVEDFLKKLNKQNEDKNEDKNEGDDSASDSENSNQSGSSGAQKSLEDLVNEAVKNAEKAMKAEEATKQKAKSAVEDHQRRAGTEAGTTGKAKVGEEKRKEVYLNAIRKLAKFLKRSERKTNMLYYAKKGKTAGGIIIPKRETAFYNSKKDIVILIDVSGSQDPKEIKSVCEAIAEVANANIHIVTWNTCYSEHFDFKKGSSLKNLEVEVGGGTDLSNGVEWCEDHYKKISNFFLFSDFEDADVNKLLRKVSKLKRAKKCTTNALFSSNVPASTYKEILKGKPFSNVLKYDGTLKRV